MRKLGARNYFFQKPPAHIINGMPLSTFNVVSGLQSVPETQKNVSFHLVFSICSQPKLPLSPKRLACLVDILYTSKYGNCLFGP